MRLVRDLVARGLVKLVEQALKTQRLQVTLLIGETAYVEHAQPYGLEANPPADAQALVLFVGGDRAHGLAVAVSDRASRPKNLAPGEVCLYSKHGNQIVEKSDGSIEVIPAAGKKVHVVGDLDVTGNVTASGNVTDAAGSMAAIRLTYNSHTHISAAPGSSTAAPVPQM
ncbi:MAG: phage baseplate assembly protein V [Deltaproteobacteria bacterium]|nr:phage baseplate assembly protein V [Deltaproteobacteria bacterium]